jgi:hypothetical protein
LLWFGRFDLEGVGIQSNDLTEVIYSHPDSGIVAIPASGIHAVRHDNIGVVLERGGFVEVDFAGLVGDDELSAVPVRVHLAEVSSTDGSRDKKYYDEDSEKQKSRKRGSGRLHGIPLSDLVEFASESYFPVSYNFHRFGR